MIKKGHQTPHWERDAGNGPARISSGSQLDPNINRRIVHVVLDSLPEGKGETAGVFRGELEIRRNVETGAQFGPVQVEFIIDDVNPLDPSQHPGYLQVAP